MSNNSNELLNSSSEKFQQIVRYLDEVIDISPSITAEHAEIFYLFDSFNREGISRFYSSADSEEFWDYCHPFEHPYKYWFAIKILDNHNVDLLSVGPVSDTIDGIARVQDRDGRITGEGGTASFARILALTEGYPDTLDSAMTYVMNQIKSEDSHHQDITSVLLVLAEFNYDKYEPELEIFSERIIENTNLESLLDFSDERFRFHRIEKAAINTWSLSRSPSKNPLANKFVEQIEENEVIEEFAYLGDEQNIKDLLAKYELSHERNSDIIEERIEEPSQEQIKNLSKSTPIEEFSNLGFKRVVLDPATSLARIGLALSAAGEGPLVPKAQSNWEQEKIEQRVDRATPKFVSTVPATNLEGREMSIRDRATRMVASASNTIRISSLYIDMLYEQILDRCQEPDSPEIRILARDTIDRGNRKKIKRAVIDELIQATEGNVRDTRLLHSRMLIADDSELLVTTADLTRDQLVDMYNSGIYTEANEPIKEAISFFDAVWETAEPVEGAK